MRQENRTVSGLFTRLSCGVFDRSFPEADGKMLR